MSKVARLVHSIGQHHTSKQAVRSGRRQATAKRAGCCCRCCCAAVTMNAAAAAAMKAESAG